MKKIRVGTIGLSYNHRKNFYGLVPKKVSYFKALDLISPYRVMMRSHILKKLLAHPVMKNIHFAPLQRKVDIFHFFNALSLSKTPWITTFETSLPRWGMDKFGLNAIASESCKGIVAMSNCAREIMLRKVSIDYPEHLEKISSKLTVIHPSQNPAIDYWDEKALNLEGKLVFTVIGNDFFRKGGAEIVRVFERLFEEGANVEVRIISNLKFGDYASQASQTDKDWVTKLISTYPDQISHYQNIPNTEVLALLKSTHVGLLPTYADTYGYSVLEYQSMACPVISTNIRALSEINSIERGWVIEVPKDEFGEGLYRNKEEREVLSKIIEKELEKTVREILTNPSLISQKGQKALVGLKEKNDPEMNAESYFQLYQKALGRHD
ncbi:glycosyltransferase family 4 protein [Algoriphagus sp. C2-6-M1]|uniref:glycosyltransferase family 4 protein n=1 Tax=Algoriphagus persicinus TaxID=3108754 RepID=UPI002B3B9F97|nr:glycosyltransferase family 4 protein [Algoriphagus sp. C2-6-M1]MEB2782437.1 glycosyltransferase family 4 protein [Algoriphagus sp. C2-6-M1]